MARPRLDSSTDCSEEEGNKMRRTNRKIGRHLSRGNQSYAGYAGKGHSGYAGMGTDDCSVRHRTREINVGKKLGLELFAKHGPGLDPNTHQHASYFDKAATKGYRLVYPQAPAHIPHANHPCALAWLNIRRYVAKEYRHLMIQHHPDAGASVNYGYKGGGNKPIFR